MGLKKNSPSPLLAPVCWKGPPLPKSRAGPGSSAKSINIAQMLTSLDNLLHS